MSFMRRKAGSLYVIPIDGPMWLDVDKPYELLKKNEKESPGCAGGPKTVMGQLPDRGYHEPCPKRMGYRGDKNPD